MSKVTQIRQRARNYLQKGKFDKAIEEYKRLTGMETKNPNYLNELGDIYLKAGDSVQAVSNFEKAVVNYEKVALYNNAVAVCKKILRIIPDRGDTIYKLGELRAKQKLSGEANVYFSQYLDHILANADSVGPELNEKINGILELIPENPEILCKAGDAMVLIGIKTGALEIYSKLCDDAERAGDGDQAAAFEAKMDLLKKSMTKEEINLVETAMASSVGDGTSEKTEPDGSAAGSASEGSTGVGVEAELSPEDAAEADDTQAVIDEEAEADEILAAIDEETGTDEVLAAIDEEAGVDEVLAAIDEEAEVEEAMPTEGVEDQPQTVDSPEIGEESPDGTEGEKVYTVNVGDVEPYEEQATGMDQSGAPGVKGEAEGEPEDQVSGEVEEDAHGGLDAVAGEEEGSGTDEGPVATDESVPESAPEAEPTVDEGSSKMQEDLSGLLDDSRNADTAENLAEEITSDVEEDDFRSHYDVGMAYLEMALYTEAIKEFQVASRSEQIRIKSIEMIGHCFLMQNNPRLAVKQLLRGLELVKVANSDSLGVHYNLGLAYEMLGDLEKAREHYEEVYIVDISFRDIGEKMKKLSTVS